MTIVQNGDPVLRKVAKPVAQSEFGTQALATILEDMRIALESQKDGVALAAPQIGVSKRIFIVRYDRMTAPTNDEEAEREAQIGVYINPEFVRKARKKEPMEEGCLSVRGKYGKTIRATRATVRAKDEHGKVFERGGGGILAQAFQHEIDHLDGILFIDHAHDQVDVAQEDIPKKPRRTQGWISPEEAHA